MGKEAFILILEDYPDDAELVERELRRGGILFVSKRVETGQAFAQALSDSPPELILSDYRLREFDGLQALEMARRRCPDVPFILMSGVGGEDLAIEAFRRGATDYVLKDRLYRLVPAIKDALELAERRRAERAARETERKFFALAETLPAIVFVHQDGKFRYLNPAGERIIGYPLPELIGTNFRNIIRPDFRELVCARGLSRQLGDIVPARHEFPIVTRAGETRWLDCTATRIDFDGHPAVLGSALDITDARRAAEALRDSEHRFRLLVDAMPDFIFRVRGDGTILDVKAPKDADLPVSVGELMGKALLELAPVWLVEPTRYYLERTLQTGEIHSFEFQLPWREERRDFEARIAVCGADEVLAIVRDVTERKRLEEEVLEISARERRRIGHDLHDGLGQCLAAIALKAKVLENDLSAESSPHTAAAKKLIRLINSAIQQGRSVARGLDPIDVEASGLAVALGNLVAETEDLFHVTCNLHCTQPELPVTRFAALQLYRITQEGINNAVKHGRPGQIEIRLATEATHVRLRIKDDGRGFRSATPSLTGMGLRIMHYRAHVIGGVLKIDSRPGRGTEIQCLVPMARGPDSGVLSGK
jgi:PAS domain S-box-containing protein